MKLLVLLNDKNVIRYDYISIQKSYSCWKKFALVKVKNQIDSSNTM